jgi:hypothetical protein
MLAGAMASPSRHPPYARGCAPLAGPAGLENGENRVVSLSGKDKVELARLLSSALNILDLELYVQESTGDRLFVDLVAPGRPVYPTIVELLNRLEELGQISVFLGCVYVNRPARADIRAAISRFFPDAGAVPEQKIEFSAQTAGAPQIDAPTNALVPGLQRNLRPNLGRLDIEAWKTRLMQIELQVCRMEVDGSALGTGFLVGPDMVLTAWHIFEGADKAGKGDRMACRFDYGLAPDGTVKLGQLFMVQAGGCIDSSPYSAAEVTDNPDNPPPTTEELDYALLRLGARVGEQEVDGVVRGWVRLPKVTLPLPADSPILIVQHPEGGPIKLALDTQAVIGLNANGTRIRYRTETEPGAGGSPVFTMDWDIVAMHHLRDPNWRNPAFRQGVPIELIRQRIDRNGFGAALVA